MELLTELAAFILWLWYFAWRILLGAFVLFVVANTVVSVYKKKRMRNYVQDPFDWLSVMSSVRWDTKGDLAEYMNVMFKHEIFKVRHFKEDVWVGFYHKHLAATDLIMILEDLSFLEEEELIESRILYCTKEGGRFSKENLPPHLQSSGEYLRRHEYRKTEKGGEIKRNRTQLSKSSQLPLTGLSETHS